MMDIMRHPVSRVLAYLTLSVLAVLALSSQLQAGPWAARQLELNRPWQGRVNGIALRPERRSCLVATATGGLFLSKDMRGTFADVDSLPVLPLRHVAWLKGDREYWSVTSDIDHR